MKGTVGKQCEGKEGRGLSIYKPRREASEDTNLDVKLLASRIVRERSSFVQITQSVVLCHGRVSKQHGVA